MALKFTIAKLEDVEEAFRPLYKKHTDGTFRLDAEGVVAEEEYNALDGKLTEFRDNNRKLFNDNKTLVERYKDVDPDEYKTLKQANKTQPNEIAQAIAEAVAKATGPLSDRLGKVESERDDAKRQLTNKERDDLLWQIGSKAGVREEAKPDFLRRAQGVFTYEAGKLVAMEGDRPLYSKRRGQTTTPLSAEEWAVEHLVADAPFLYKESGGGGANKGKQNTDTGTGRLIANEPLAIGLNLEDIASGKAVIASA